MPAVVNFAASIVLGASMVLAVRRAPAIHRELLSWPFFFLLAFQALVVTPAVVYLFRFFPQWSMLYWFDPQIHGAVRDWAGLLSVLVMLAHLGAVVAGYLVARYGVMIASRVVVALPIVVASLGMGAVIALFYDRLLYVGDYDTFWQGKAPFVMMTPAGWVGLVLYLAAGGFLFWVNKRFGKHGPTFL